MKFKFIHYFFLIIFLSGVIGGQFFYVETPSAKTLKQIIEQEIQQYDNSQALRQLWEQVVNESNAVKRLELISATLKLLNKEKQPYLWGSLYVIAGDILSMLDDFNRAENLERAIEHFQQALEVCTRKIFSEECASTQNNLANVYNLRISGKRTDNLERAIEYCQQALTVYTRKAFPIDWAGTQITGPDLFIVAFNNSRQLVGWVERSETHPT
jgi:tetratricopeptide (TPR) repeat protein